MIMTMTRCPKKICRVKKWERLLYRIPIFILLISYTGYSQTLSHKMNVPHGKLVELKMNMPVIFEDSLTLTLTSFSHKHAMTGGPTKATAYVTVMKEGQSDEIMLSVHGTENKVKNENGQVVFEEYDTIIWKDYKIDLQHFSYDDAISIVVSKK